MSQGRDGKHWTKRPDGFTLIEVLALLAVVAVFIVLMVPPGCGGGHENGRRAACMNNLKQIGLGVIQYSQDYDEQYPRIMFGQPSLGASTCWRQSVEPYIRTLDVWKCSANPIGNSVSQYDKMPQSYDVTDVGPIQRLRSITLDQVHAPATTILAMEETGDTAEAQQIGVSWDSNLNRPGWEQILFSGHLGQANYLFTDGHVKSMKPMQTIANDVNMWHLHNEAKVTADALRKLQAAANNSG